MERSLSLTLARVFLSCMGLRSVIRRLACLRFVVAIRSELSLESVDCRQTAEQNARPRRAASSPERPLNWSGVPHAAHGIETTFRLAALRISLHAAEQIATGTCFHAGNDIPHTAQFRSVLRGLSVDMLSLGQ